MSALVRMSLAIDRILTVLAKTGAWLGGVLVLVVVFDVITRKMGVNKEQVFGFNSTQIQESEYWLHTFLFSLVLGWAYLRQAHVRIDLLRERLGLRAKYWIEILGCAVFLIPYTLIGGYYCILYTYSSFLEGEVSKSTIGLSHIWVVKSAIPLMFFLLGLAGLAVLLKAVAGLRGELPQEMIGETIGSDH